MARIVIAKWSGFIEGDLRCGREEVNEDQNEE